MDSLLLGGLLKGIIEISKFALDKGYIKEVQLDNGFLLVNKLDKILVGVMTTRSSNYLENCIERFTFDLFQNSFLFQDSGCVDVGTINKCGVDLIEKNFSFIAPPDRTKKKAIE